MLTLDQIKALCMQGESNRLDYKRDQYPFDYAADGLKAEFLKDILSFANSFRSEPAYILMAVDRVGFFGAHTVILGWYDNEDSVKKEVEEIVNAIDQGNTTYKLQYYTNVEFKGIFGSASRK